MHKAKDSYKGDQFPLFLFYLGLHVLPQPKLIHKAVADLYIDPPEFFPVQPHSVYHFVYATDKRPLVVYLALVIVTQILALTRIVPLVGEVERVGLIVSDYYTLVTIDDPAACTTSRAWKTHKDFSI